MNKEKVILSNGKEFQVESAKVKHILSANKMYKDEFEKEVYIVSCCTGCGMDEIEELETSDYSLLVKTVFKLGK